MLHTGRAAAGGRHGLRRVRARRAAGAAEWPAAALMLASLSVFRGRGAGRAWALMLQLLSFGGFAAMFLYLRKLLTGVPPFVSGDRLLSMRRFPALQQS